VKIMAEVARKIEFLRRYITSYPGLADVPIITVRGQPLSAREALNWLERGRAVSGIISALKAERMDPPAEEDIWAMAIAYYERLARLPGPKPRIMIMGYEMTLDEVLVHLRARDEIGSIVVAAFEQMRRYALRGARGR